jgi:hypothetical protein
MCVLPSYLPIQTPKTRNETKRNDKKNKKKKHACTHRLAAEGDRLLGQEGRDHHLERLLLLALPEPIGFWLVFLLVLVCVVCMDRCVGSWRMGV